MAKIKSEAKANIEILGYQSFEELRKYMQAAKALVFAAEEDFGILPVEVQACGTPVIAYGKGGATETVIEGQTGLFFNEQSERAIIEAVKKFESEQDRYEPSVIRAHTEKFAPEMFRSQMEEFVTRKYSDFLEKGR